MSISISFDVEPDLHSEKFLSITEGIPVISKILKKHNVKATFFTTCDCIENYPQIFKELENQGHEIALHGYRHTRFDDLSTEERDLSIKKSIVVFKKYLKGNPRGFRAPQHSINGPTFKVLEKYDIKYDSSKTPLNLMQIILFPKRIKMNLFNFFSRPYKYKIGKVYEIPTTSFFLPFVSIIIRVFPRWMQKGYMTFIRVLFKDKIFYAHSWDFIKIPRSRIDNAYPHIKVINNFDFMIGYLKRTEKFVKMEEMI